MKWFKTKQSSRAQRRQVNIMEGQGSDNSFQRSRTLTQPRKKQAGLQSDRAKKQTLRRQRQILGVTLIAVIIVTSCMAYLISQYSPIARDISYHPLSSLVRQPNSQQYAQTVTDYLSKYPLQRFRFNLDQMTLTDFVNQRHPEIKQVALKTGETGYVDFAITFRSPVVVWNIGDKHYYVDAQGETFRNNYLKEPSVQLTDESGVVSQEDGKVIATKGFLRFLGRLIALGNQSGLGKVEKAVLPPNTTRQVDITFGKRPYTIKTNSDRDPAQEIEDIKRVVGYLEKQRISPKYIDVRVEGRAYYR